MNIIIFVIKNVPKDIMIQIINVKNAIINAKIA